MQSKTKRLLVAGGIGLASTLVMAHLAKSPAGAKEAPMRPVLVLTARVKAHMPLGASDVKLEQRPISYVASGAISVPQHAVGRIAKADLEMGQEVLEDQLLAPGEQAAAADVAFPLPAGKRAVTVAVDEVVGVAGFVQPGSVVDVVGTLDLNGVPFSKVILQAISVLAVAQDAQRKDGDAQAKVSSSATLAVTPADAEKLILAAERGKIRLAIRAPGEARSVKTAGATPYTEEGVDAPKPAPVPGIVHVVSQPRPAYHPAPSGPTILVIRGTSTEVVSR